MSVSAESLPSILPNLAIGVVAILALAYVVRYFVDHLKSRDQANSAEFSEIRREHRAQLDEREKAMRGLEAEVRTTVTEELKRSTELMGRVVNFLEGNNYRQAPARRRIK